MAENNKFIWNDGEIFCSDESIPDDGMDSQNQPVYQLSPYKDLDNGTKNDADYLSNNPYVFSVAFINKRIQDARDLVAAGLPNNLDDAQKDIIIENANRSCIVSWPHEWYNSANEETCPPTLPIDTRRLNPEPLPETLPIPQTLPPFQTLFLPNTKAISVNPNPYSYHTYPYPWPQLDDPFDEPYPEPYEDPFTYPWPPPEKDPYPDIIPPFLPDPEPTTVPEPEPTTAPEPYGPWLPGTEPTTVPEPKPTIPGPDPVDPFAPGPPREEPSIPMVPVPFRGGGARPMPYPYPHAPSRSPAGPGPNRYPMIPVKPVAITNDISATNNYYAALNSGVNDSINIATDVLNGNIQAALDMASATNIARKKTSSDAVYCVATKAKYCIFVAESDFDNSTSKSKQILKNNLDSSEIQKNKSYNPIPDVLIQIYLTLVTDLNQENANRSKRIIPNQNQNQNPSQIFNKSVHIPFNALPSEIGPSPRGFTKLIGYGHVVSSTENGMQSNDIASLLVQDVKTATEVVQQTILVDRWNYVCENCPSMLIFLIELQRTTGDVSQFTEFLGRGSFGVGPNKGLGLGFNPGALLLAKPRSSYYLSLGTALYNNTNGINQQLFNAVKSKATSSSLPFNYFFYDTQYSIAMYSIFFSPTRPSSPIIYYNYDEQIGAPPVKTGPWRPIHTELYWDVFHGSIQHKSLII